MRTCEHKGRMDFLIRENPAAARRMAAAARLQSTESSNRMEGIETTGVRLRRLLEGKAAPENSGEARILGCSEVLDAIRSRRDAPPLSPALILRLHEGLMRRARPDEAGRVRKTQNCIVETRPDGSRALRFMPPPSSEAEAAVGMMCEAFERALHEGSVPPLILIPALICDFLCIHPFGDGNGRVSRLLTLLLLKRCGVAVGKYVSMEKFIEKTSNLYYDALLASGIGWREGENDPARFIRCMLNMILSSSVEFEERLGICEGEDGRRSSYGAVKTYVSGKTGKFIGADVLLSCPAVGRSSALAALKRLAEEKAVIKHGSGRTTFCVRSDALGREFWARERTDDQ